jgi:hypothetical protein
VKLGSDRLVSAITVLAALLALPLRADDADTKACPAIDPPASAVQKALPAEALAKAGGLRVFRDPETGQLRPLTREEAAEVARVEAEAATESEPIFVVVEHPDGMKSVDLQGALMQSVTVTRNPDGSLTFSCGPARLVAAPAPAAPVPQARPALEEK